MKADYIVIGNGIAGSVLAYTLISHGCWVMVVG